jgi:hypothetical protein
VNEIIAKLLPGQLFFIIALIIIVGGITVTSIARWTSRAIIGRYEDDKEEEVRPIADSNGDDSSGNPEE